MNFRGRKITAALLAGGAVFAGAGIGSAIAANSNQTDTTSTTSAHKQQSRAGGGHHEQNPVVKAAVQKLLGVNDAAMRTARDSGQTLAQLAATKGVSQADLVSTIVSALKASKPAGAPELSNAQLTEKVTERVTSARGQGDHGPRGGNNQVRAKVGQVIASTLGITTAELKAAHKAGTTPATLASQKGVAKADLVSAVSTALKANKPANAPAMTDAQLAQKATNIVDGVHPGPGGPGGSHSQGRR
ncbi:MAG: hypothetical protein ACOYL4_05560 [Miltoncostaeaceae bacterium]